MTETKSLGRGQWMVLLAAFLGWMFDGVEIGLFPLVARPALHDLHAHELAASPGLAVNQAANADGEPRIERSNGEEGFVQTWNGRIQACFLLGAACGGLIFGWLGDRIGRVRSMILSVLMYSCFTGTGYFATAPWHLALFRFIAALGMGGEWSLGVALVMECWPEKARPILAGAIGAAANFGFLLIAVVAFFVPVTQKDWRWMMLVGAVPALLALFISLAVPESERWKKSVQKAARSPLREIFAPGLRKVTLLAIVFSAIPLIGTWAAVSGWIPLWADQLAGPEVPHAKALIQMVMATGAVCACFAAPLLATRLGRRPAYFALCAVSLVSCQVMFRAVYHYDALFVALAFVVGGATAAFYAWLPHYLPELFPTRVRATGQGLSYNFGRFLAAAGTLQMGQLAVWLGGDPARDLRAYPSAMSWMTLVYAVGLGLIWLAPETKGKPLPD